MHGMPDSREEKTAQPCIEEVRQRLAGLRGGAAQGIWLHIVILKP